jgi:hypothetical protein
MEETINEPSIEDPLEKCLTAFGGDMDLNTLLEQANALLDSIPEIETDTGATTKTSPSDPSPSAAKPVK